MSNKKYIDVEKAKEEILSNAVDLNKPQFLVKDDAIFILDNIPPADVEEIRHAEWNASGEYTFVDGSLAIRCTECGCALRSKEFKEYYWHYCPVCGAKMDGKEEGR